MLSAKDINDAKPKNNDQWIKVSERSGCYLFVPKSAKARKRFVGMSRIGLSKGKRPYKVPLGFWGDDFTKPSEVLRKWEEIKSWGLKNNCDLRKFGDRNNLRDKETTLNEVCDLFLQWKSGHVKPSTYTTIKNRLNQILRYLPDGILVDDFPGQDGRRFILERVCSPSIGKGHPYTAKRHRRLLNEVFKYAVEQTLLHPDQLPYRLDLPYPFEKNIKSGSHPHLPWDQFRNEFIPILNANPCNASRLTELATKALMMTLTRASVVVSMEWDWYDQRTNCWVIPSETEGLKRKFDDVSNDHYIPNTPQLEVLMNNLHSINGNQKYVFFSPYKGKNPYLSKQTPNDHLINLKYQGKQDAHGFRHVATNALVDIARKDKEMVSRCLGHLNNEGAIGHYDFAKRLDERKEIHECWNQLLIDEGLRI